MLSALLLAGLGLFAAQAPAAQADDARQVLWQRSLADALALSASSGRPLLVAVNTDAESASERIVGEVYRDPRFVAASRAFVCLIASPLRHTPRDHDGRGACVIDPRFGEVTSGEAVALEPLLFERFLGGDRIAPRHALVRDPGGAAEKAFDLFQLYDFELLIAALEREAAALGGAFELELELDVEFGAAPQQRAAQWAALAAARSQRNRARLEARLARAPGAQLGEALTAIAAGGDADPATVDPERCERDAQRLERRGLKQEDGLQHRLRGTLLGVRHSPPSALRRLPTIAASRRWAAFHSGFRRWC